MPTVFKFRVSFEDYDDVIRDIEIKSTQTFEELHFSIQSCVGFDSTKPASFFISNEYWIKGQEISLQAGIDKDGAETALMKDAKLSTYIIDPHQKIIYHSDYDSSWFFRIELVKILPQADIARNYPVCVKSVGEAPKQYKITSVPKNVVAEENELDKLLMGGLKGAAVVDIIDNDEEDEVSESMMDVSEDGVDEDEIAGMGEEGEEDATLEEGDESEADFAEGDDDKQEEF